MQRLAKNDEAFRMWAIQKIQGLETKLKSLEGRYGLMLKVFVPSVWATMFMALGAVLELVRIIWYSAH
jgi:hypothetical protein